MKVGRFTITNLSEPEKSDFAVELKKSKNPDDSLESKQKADKPALQTLSKPGKIENFISPIQKQLELKDSLNSNVKTT